MFDGHMPTKRELEARYGCKMDKFPYGEMDDCCSKDEYPSDFISHRMLYHKISIEQTMKELDEFMNEITLRHDKQNEELR